MNTPHNSHGALAGLRILDAAEYIAVPYAARLLCDLGAEVIKLESPAGDGLRQHGPFPAGHRSPDTSAMFHLMNSGKAGLVMDPASPDAETKLDAAVKEADVVLCSEGSAFANLIARRKEKLLDRHPALVIGHATAAPAEWKAACRSDASLHAASLGGVSAVIGEPGRAPIVPPYDILEYLVGANLAAAVLAALFARDLRGQGQYVEIVASDMAAQYVMTPRINDLISRKSTYTRTGRRSPGAMGGIYPWGLYPCGDGLVTIVSHAKKNWQALLSMLGNPDWAKNPRFEDPLEIARACADEVDKLMGKDMQCFTRMELFELAVKNSFALGPVQTVKDVMESKHLQARGSLSSISLGGRALPYIKRPYLLFGTPIPAESQPAPALGAPGKDSGSIWRSPRTAQATGKWRSQDAMPQGRGALSGMRVIDFSWNWAAPMVGSALADMGAEVIRIEHRGRLDNSRFRARPSVHGKPVEGPLEEVSYYFHQNNRGKLGATFDIKDKRGAELVGKLLDSADLVLENFTPGVFERAGLGYETIRKTNPSIVWLSMTSAGHSGPLAGIRTYAPVMSALAGLESLVGYENEEPVGMLGYSFGDVNGGAHGIAIALAALRHARATGQGQFIDFSLTETQMSVLAEPMAEIALGGPNPGTQGMQHRRLAPHGHYRCAGDDQWLALSVRDANAWRALAALVSPQGLALREELNQDEARRQQRQAIDEAIEAWTRTRQRNAAVGELQALGIAATPVLSSHELARDWPEDKFFELPHPATGRDRVLLAPWRMSLTPPYSPRPAPMIGEHTRHVLENILGLSAQEADALLASPATH